MPTLSLKIPIWKFTRTINRKAPASWNELSREQLFRLIDVIYTPEDSLDKLKIRITRILFGLSWHHILLMTPFQLAYLNSFGAWVLEGNELTDNKILTIRQKFSKYYGPIGDFSSLKGKEWTDADEAYLEYNRTKDEKALDLLIAILWRPRNKKVSPKDESWNGDHRVPYNRFTAEQRAKRFAKLNPLVKLAIFTWYQGCRLEWEKFYERVFSGSGEDVENYGWMETMQKLSGSSFGNLFETEETYMWKLLLKIQIDLKDNEIMERKNSNR